jgi:nucleotide-binding universal stress UspA family protein
MFKRILLPLDGSQMAESALIHGMALARLTQAELYVLHVLAETQEESVDPMQWYLRKAAAQAYLDTVCARLTHAGFQATGLMPAGNPSERIIDQIERLDIDLVVLSAHGESGRSDGSLGAVAYKLLEGVGISAMLVQNGLPVDAEREIAPAEYAKLFVPLDGSRRAECVLPIAEQLAAAHRATVLLAHVLQRPAVFGQSALQDEDPQPLETLLARSQQKAEAYLADVQERMGETAQTLLSTADNTAMELGHLIEAESVDLLLLSAHGAASNPRRAFGDTLRSLLNYVRIPVLIYQDRPLIGMSREFDAPQRNYREGVLDM